MTRRSQLSRAIAALPLAALLAAPLAHAAPARPSLSITQGTLIGVTANGVNSFNGIPYAAPPVGALRWKPPAAAPSWSGQRDASAFGSQCPQPLSQFGHQGNNEDCLYLNVQTPAGTAAGAKLPVMLWIHGGAFITGEGWDYDGTALVTEGHVVVVTLNYRLGLLGFLAHPALAAEAAGASGNYGLMDQQAAMGWVRANIAAFGGNPANITIFGESAGGASVLSQLISPTAPKFHRAIIQSGVYATTLPTQAQAQAQGTSMMSVLGCTSSTDASCLRALPASAVVAAINPLDSLGGAGPVLDGTTLTTQPAIAMAQGQFARVPVMNGSNHDEWRLFVALYDLFGTGYPLTAASYAASITTGFGDFAPTVLATYPLANYASANYADAALVTDSGFACGGHLSRALMAQYVPVYGYELTDPHAPDLFLPYDPNMQDTGAAHAAELPYLFPLLQSSLFGKGVAKFTPPQAHLAQQMRAAWTSFARYGRPLMPGAGAWPGFSAAHPWVSAFTPPSPRAGLGFVADHHCDVWKPYLLQAAGLAGTVPF